MGIEEVRHFLFWCMLINVGIYCFSTLALLSVRELVCRINERLFGLDRETVLRSIQAWVGAYKLLILVFCFAPWLALVILR